MNVVNLDSYTSRIDNGKTKEYFKEVLSCYASGSLRSAVVMLYSVVIYDLVAKLECLKNQYGDKGAEKILNDIESKQKSNPTSSEWEKDVPQRMLNANKVIDAATYSNIDSLKNLRNLCAHPVIGTDLELYRPNESTVLGHMRNMLEGVFCKPSFMSKQLIDMILDSAENVGKTLNSNSLKEYIKAEYLDKINDPAQIYKIFKQFWKFVFNKDGDKFSANRHLNYYVLELLIDVNNGYTENEVKKDVAYFKDIDDSKLDYLIMFYNYHFSLFYNMPETYRVLLTSKIQYSQHWSKMALFLQSNPRQYIDSLSLTDFNFTLGSMSKWCLPYINEYARINYGPFLSVTFSIRMYSEVWSYDVADFCFDNLIKCCLYDMTQSDFESLLNVISSNGQIHGRKKAIETNQLVKSVINSKFSQFDFSRYPNFKC